MKWLKKLLNRVEPVELTVIDKRKGSKPIELMDIQGEDDAILAHVLSAAWQSDDPVVGTFKNGKLIIKHG